MRCPHQKRTSGLVFRRSRFLPRTVSLVVVQIEIDGLDRSSLQSSSALRFAASVISMDSARRASFIKPPVAGPTHRHVDSVDRWVRDDIMPKLKTLHIDVPTDLQGGNAIICKITHRALTPGPQKVLDMRMAKDRSLKSCKDISESSPLWTAWPMLSRALRDLALHSASQGINVSKCDSTPRRPAGAPRLRSIRSSRRPGPASRWPIEAIKQITEAGLGKVA